jgi:hypothetical protein
MAGAGYKLFATGDVLTAAQVNTYLNEQTVMVFASSAARTSALSGVLAEGMMSYLQDTNSVEVYNGTAWVSVGGGGGDVTEVQAGVGISVASGTGPIPVVTNTVATAFDAAGDLVYGTGADTFTKLSLGTAGQVLKVNSGATAPEWGAAAGGGDLTYTLLNSGGTALTGAATITVSGISNKNTILILISEASSANASAQVCVRINTDTGSNYDFYRTITTAAATYAATNQSSSTTQGLSRIPIATLSNNADSFVNGYCRLESCKSGTLVAGLFAASSDAGGGSGHTMNVGSSIYAASAAVTSVSLFSTNGNFDGGTMYVYGA